jgi:hypothetical protein
LVALRAMPIKALARCRSDPLSGTVAATRGEAVGSPNAEAAPPTADAIAM